MCTDILFAFASCDYYLIRDIDLEYDKSLNFSLEEFVHFLYNVIFFDFDAKRPCDDTDPMYLDEFLMFNSEEGESRLDIIYKYLEDRYKEKNK